MIYDNIFLILLEITRSTGNLEEYFIKRTKRFYLYLFPAAYVEKESRLIYYENGKKIYEKIFFWYRGKNKILKTIFYYVYYCYIVLFILPVNTKIITYQVLFCLFSKIFNLLKRTTYIFCVGDYFPVRNNISSKLYHRLVSFYNTHLNYVLYPSEKLREAYTTKTQNSLKYRDIIPYGIKKLHFKKNPIKNLLGYVGNLRPGQGIELIFEVLQKNKDLRLEIIGSKSSSMMQSLVNLTKKLAIRKRVKFLGFLPDEKHIINAVKRWQMGLAPYDPNPNNLTFYAEPSKIKFYLQYKLPVIMTKITSTHLEIEKYRAGVTIDYSTESLIQAIRKIQKNYSIFQTGVDKLTDIYEYNDLYNKRFKFIKNI